MKTTANRIKEGMEIRGLRQADLVEKTGISKGALSSYISGRYIPKQNNILLIAKALNINESWLMGYDVPMDRDNSPQNSENSYPDLDFTKQLHILLQEYGDKPLKFLSILCKNIRIERDLTERYVASCSDIELKEYLEFENYSSNIETDQLIKILKTLELDANYVLGFLTGALFTNDPDSAYKTISKLYDADNPLNYFLHQLIQMDSEEIHLISNEMKKKGINLPQRPSFTSKTLQELSDSLTQLNNPNKEE